MTITGIAQALRTRGCQVRSIDYNPQLVRSGDTMGYPVLYGDAGDPEFIASLPLARVQWVVSTTRERHVNQTMIHSLRSVGYAGRIAVAAHSAGEVVRLEQAGADLVLVPLWMLLARRLTGSWGRLPWRRCDESYIAR